MPYSDTGCFVVSCVNSLVVLFRVQAFFSDAPKRQQLRLLAKGREDKSGVGLAFLTTLLKIVMTVLVGLC